MSYFYQWGTGRDYSEESIADRAVDRSGLEPADYFVLRQCHGLVCPRSRATAVADVALEVLAHFEIHGGLPAAVAAARRWRAGHNAETPAVGPRMTTAERTEKARPSPDLISPIEACAIARVLRATISAATTSGALPSFITKSPVNHSIRRWIRRSDLEAWMSETPAAAIAMRRVAAAKEHLRKLQAERAARRRAERAERAQ